MIWDDVEDGDVLQDVHRNLWLVTGKSVREDDAEHPFLVVRIYCLSDPEHRGSSVYQPLGRRLEDISWSVWRGE